MSRRAESASSAARPVGRIFDQVVDLPPNLRGAALDRLCAQCSTTRRQVEALLAAADVTCDTADLLPRRATRSSTPSPSPLPGLDVGVQVGPYRLIELLGAGGMGEVYLAERADGEFDHRVAVKLVGRHLATDAMTERFRAERQILARLAHPNVARLFDGGTTADGRPYLVMEHIEGTDLLRHADDRGLSLRARLRLVRQVCDAVALAHAQGVIHRDVKPSNVLVDAAGRPKLLDFGIAARLDAADPQRRDRAAGPLTPTWASPEQLRGEALTPASDVYSLGLILRRLAGDALDAEVGGGPLEDLLRTSLAEDPGARIQTAARLRDEIDRLLATLEDETSERPVGRTRGLRRRTGARTVAVKAAVIAAAVLLSALLWRADRTTGFDPREASTLSVSARDAESMPPPPALPSTLLAFDLERRMLMRSAAGEEIDPESMRIQLLDTFGRLELASGRPDQAKQIYGTALLGRSEEAGSGAAKGPRPISFEEAVGWRNLGVALADLGAYDASSKALARGPVLVEEGSHQVVTPQRTLEALQTLEARALLQWRVGDLAEAEELLRRALVLRCEICPPTEQYWTAAVLDHLAVLMRQQGRLDEASSFAARARAERGKIGSSLDHLALDGAGRAEDLAARGDLAGAIAAWRKVVEARRALARQEVLVGGFGRAQAELAVALHRFGRALGEHGLYDEAIDNFRESQALSATLRQPETPDALTVQNNLAVVLHHRGTAHGSEDDWRQAEALFRHVLSRRRALLGDRHVEVAQVLYSRARLHLDRGDLATARIDLEASDAILAETVAADHPVRHYARLELARLAELQRRPADALAILHDVLPALRDSHVGGHWRIAEAEALWARAHWRLDGRSAQGSSYRPASWSADLVPKHSGDRDLVRQILAESLDILRAQRGEGSPRARRVELWWRQARFIP